MPTRPAVSTDACCVAIKVVSSEICAQSPDWGRRPVGRRVKNDTPSADELLEEVRGQYTGPL